MRFGILVVVIIVLGAAVGAGAVYLKGQGGENGGGSATSQLRQLAPGTGSLGEQGQSATGPQTGGQPGNVGTVENVSASGFTLASQSGQLQVVTNGDTKVTKMSEGKISELKVGESIIVTGNQQTDGSITAASIQVGAADSLGGMGAGFANRAGQFGQGDQQGQNQRSGPNRQPQETPQAGMQGFRGSTVFGAIEAVDEKTITVKSQAGSSSKVSVSGDTVVRKLVEGTLSDIQNGQTAIVGGERDSAGAIVATSIQLSPPGIQIIGR